MVEMRCLTDTSILVLRETAARLGGKPFHVTVYGLELKFCISLVCLLLRRPSSKQHTSRVRRQYLTVPKRVKKRSTPFAFPFGTKDFSVVPQSSSGISYFSVCIRLSRAQVVI